MNNYQGDIDPGDSIRFSFNSRDTDGAPITLDSGAIRVYKDDGTTEDDSGITLNTDFDSKTGLHLVEIDTSADGTFYSTGADFTVVISDGTVDSISVVGVCVGTFSIQNRSALRPSVAGRTIGVESDGDLTKVNTLDGHTPQTADHTASIAAILVDTGTTLQAELDAIQAAVITNAAGTDIAADIIALKAVADAVLVDTAEIGAAGAGLTEAGGTGDQLTALATASAQTTAQDDLDIITGTAGALIDAGTGTGQLDITSGVVKANLAQILGTALTETAGLLAAGFKKFFNVATPTGTLNSLPDAVPGAAGGVFIAGSNAATTFATLTVTGTTTLTGNVSLGGTLTVSGTTSLAAVSTSGTLTLNALTVTNATTLSGAVALGSTLTVTGATSLAAVSMTTLTASGAVALQSTVTVTGATTLTGNVSLGGTLTVTGAATFSDTTNGTLGAIIADLEDGGRTDLLIDGLVADHPNRPARGVELANLEFMMVDATDLNTPETGITVTATISKDGGAFAACTNSVSEISGGWYKLTLTSTEMTADAVAVKLTGTGCAQTNIAIRTQPT